MVPFRRRLERGVRAALVAVVAAASFAPSRADAVWRRIDPGFFPESIAVAPTNPRRIVATTSYGLAATSQDGGRTWEQGVPVLGSGGVVFDGLDEHTLYRSDWAGFWRSVDDGRTWTLRGPYPGGAVFPDPADPHDLILSSGYRSADGGGTWMALPPCPGQLFMVPGARSLFAGAWPQNTLHESTDRGVTWRLISNGFPQSNPLVGIAVDPGEPTRRYAAFGTAGGGGGVFLSTDGGETWTVSNAGFPFHPMASAIAMDPNDPRVLYVSTWNGVYRSGDRGATWEPDVRGIPADAESRRAILAGNDAGEPFLLAYGTGTWGLARETGFDPLPPCRVFDSRSRQELVAGRVTRVGFVGTCGIPEDAVSVALNVTVIQSRTSGALGLSPDDPGAPAGRLELPVLPGRTRATATIQVLGPGGDLGLLPLLPPEGSLDVVLDVSGFFH